MPEHNGIVSCVMLDKRQYRSLSAYLAFTGSNPFTLKTYNIQKNWNGTLEYSTDTQNWSVWDGTTTLNSGINKGKNVLYLRGTGNTKIAGQSSDPRYFSWVFPYASTVSITCTGNIENLLDYQTVINGDHPTMDSYCFAGLFYGCAALKSVSPDLLPATQLSSYCYDHMFYSCRIVSPPSLPATTLAYSCYSEMFQDCTFLVSAPELPAAVAPSYCYAGMFQGCTALTTPPALPATTLMTECYREMFYGCTSLTTLPELPATALTAADCYAFMFYSCTSIKLSITQTGEYQTPYRIPSVGTGTAGTSSLSNMFVATGGTWKGTPAINITYYTSNTVVSAS